MTLTIQEINAALKKLNYNQPEELTQAKLKELFSYNPKTGIFKRKISVSKNTSIGDIAGSKTKQGYLVIIINYKGYYVQRLAWLYVHGYFPEHRIDHINRIKTDNRLCNLREISHSCNLRNSGIRSDNRSGITGISWTKAQAQWCVRITVNNKAYFLGRFSDYEEAICHRLAAEQCLDWSDCNSTSAAYQYVQERITKKGACNEDDRL